MRELCSIIAAPKREKDEAKALKKQRIGLLGRLQREEHEEKEKLEEGKGAKVGNKKFQQMTSKAQQHNNHMRLPNGLLLLMIQHKNIDHAKICNP
jgi:hypothetical protein